MSANPWLTRLVPKETEAVMYGRPLDKNGNIIYEPFTRPDDGGFIPQSESTVSLMSLQRRPQDALLIGQLKVANASIRLSGSPSSSGPYIITTPNANYLPNINIGPQVVVPRLDGRYGPEDWAQWPQWYFEDRDHFPYILRRPRKEHMPTHPLRRLWWDMTEDGFIKESGSEEAGQLRESITNEFNELFTTLKTEISAEDWDGLPEDERKIHKAITPLRHGTKILKYCLQTFANVLFTVTRAQRSYLETRAILDKKQKYDRRILDGTKYEVDLSVMGAVTDHISSAYELFGKGVPVWFVRHGACIPKTINIVCRDFVIDPGPSMGVVLKRLPNAPVLYTGPRSPVMYQVADQWTPPALDFSRIVDIDELAPQVQQAVEVGPSPRKARKPYFRPQKTNSQPQATAPQISINLDRFRVSSSPRSPRTIPEWEDALRSVNVDHSRIRDHPQRALFKGYAFPITSVFIDENRGCQNLLAWLAIRVPWMGALMGIESRRVALPNPQQWKWYLLETALTLEFLEDTRRPLLTTPSQSTVPSARRRQKTRDSVKEIFTCKIPKKEDVTTISWNGHVVWTAGRIDLQLVDYQSAAWDAYEHNFRAELISLDRCLMPEAWKYPHTAAEREQKLRAVFFSEVSFMVSAPPGFKNLASSDPKDRCLFVDAFRLVLADWPGDIPSRLKAIGFRKEVGVTDVWDFEAMRTVEKISYSFYCQTFFDYFGRAPSIPHTYPV